VLPSVPHAQTSRTAHGKPPTVEKTTSSLKIDVRHSGEFLPTIQEPRHTASTGESTGGMKNKVRMRKKEIENGVGNVHMNKRRKSGEELKYKEK